MPPHIVKREDCGGTYYLIDGEYVKSLKTKTKRYAEARLRQYQDEKFGFRSVPTVRAFYERWIEKKVEPLCRRSQIRDYQQCFNKHILPRFGDMMLTEIRTGELSEFQVVLLRRGLKVSTVRNIIDSSFRAMYRDARAEIEELAGRDPFLDLRWPKLRKEPPDPFTAAEREGILAYFAEREPFYYPFIRFQFETGARPSESTAITWADLNTEERTVRIDKSRHLGSENATKTTKSRRIIKITRELMDLLFAQRHKWQNDFDKVFLNKHGGPLEADQFRADYWNRILDALGIRRRRFYSTRHTFITEMIKASANPKAVADYVGTSLQMIEENYAGRLELDPTIFQRAIANPSESMASPTGFEPVLPA